MLPLPYFEYGEPKKTCLGPQTTPQDPLGPPESAKNCEKWLFLAIFDIFLGKILLTKITSKVLP